MTTKLFPRFKQRGIRTSGATINLVHGGKGPPVLLLHGYPETHAMWHKVAPRLARDHTVVCADLRCYGDSSKPKGLPDHSNYSKRAMAQDMAEVMSALGHDTSHLVGHDRGGRVAHRLARDHGRRVRTLTVLDISPTLRVFESTDMALARAFYHWFILIQRAPMPERMIEAYRVPYLLGRIGRSAGGMKYFPRAVQREYLRCFDRGKAKQHPVGMTHRIAPEQFNSDLFNSPADWISPGQEPQDWLHPGSTFLQDYRDNPPSADGRKVILSDTDHLWGHGGNHKWVWKSFLRGMNPIFMDPWRNLAGRLVRERTQWIHLAGGISKDQPEYPDWEPIRLSMGTTRRYAEKINLVAMTPHGEIASTGYCLANPGREYLVYLPNGGSVTLDLREAKGNLSIEWFFPILGRAMDGPEPVSGGNYATLAAPYSGDAVLYLVSQSA